ncbi:MAG: tryptophan--tRNA ligase, partial [Deltaproteobacteria bacterium]|nr:tryptophan--tRNA ligase [Deltaproteobacteria bacterium]
SKSYGNAIYIADDEATVRHKMMNTITDPARQKRTDPGNPDVCNIFAYHKLYTDDQKLAWVDTQCRTAGIGCVDCKKICIENALNYWRPIRERREVLEKTQGSVMDILKKGSQKAELVARATMDKVKQAMGMKYE